MTPQDSTLLYSVNDKSLVLNREVREGEEVIAIDADLLLDDEIRAQQQKDEEVRVLAKAIGDTFFETEGIGLSPKQAILSLMAAFTKEEVARLFPIAVQGRAIESAEPLLQLTNLFETVTLDEAGEAIFPVFGAISDHSIQDVGESQEYPMVEGITEAGTIIAKTGKVGLATSFTDELIQSPNGRRFMDIVIRQMGYAFARKKERKAASIIRSEGTTLFDNVDSAVLNTTGIGLDGKANGTFTQDDLLEMAAWLQNRGYTPNMVLMHPFAWFAFLKNPTNRSLATMVAQTGVTNSSVNVPRFDEDALTRLALPRSDKTQSITATVDMGVPFPQQLTFVISPYLPYRAASGTAPARSDLMMCDSNAIGYLLQRQTLTSSEFRDPKIDINFIKMSEKYAFMLADSGSAITVAKNVATLTGLDPWYNFTLTQALDSGWGGSTAIYTP